MCCAKDALGERYLEISLLGLLFMAISEDGKKMVLGLKFTISFISGLGLMHDVSLVPYYVAVDSQSVETATMIYREVGYDTGKKIHGRKRHLTVDLLGLVLRVLVTSASLPERAGAKKVLKQVHSTGDSFGELRLTRKTFTHDLDGWGISRGRFYALGNGYVSLGG